MLDMLKIGSGFMKGIVMGVITKKIKDQYGINVDIDLDTFEVAHADNKCQVVLTISGKMAMNEKDFRNVVEKALN